MTPSDDGVSSPRGPGARVWVVAAVLAAVVAAGGYLAWRRYARPVDPRYALVIARMAANDPAVRPATSSGRVSLAGGPFAGLTPHDEAIAVHRRDGSFVILFPTYYGAGSSMSGLLYSSRPFAPGDTETQQATLGAARHVINVGSYRHAEIVDRIDEHWYHVSYRMR